MYFPYLRGRLNELTMLRDEMVSTQVQTVIPIIEPVNKNTSQLTKTLETLTAEDCKAIVLVNPKVGAFFHNGQLNDELVRTCEQYQHAVIMGVLLTPEMDGELVTSTMNRLQSFALVHDGFSDVQSLLASIDDKEVPYHIFTHRNRISSYRLHFKLGNSVDIEDAFRSQTNRTYPVEEFFSDLYLTYKDSGHIGFGDYSIVGTEYSEDGGPAHAVAIHITYVSEANGSVVMCKHYVSDRKEGARDTGGKFLEALTKLVQDFERGILKQTRAIDSFRDLFVRQHFPGLGYVKRLSMQHHLELMRSLL